MELLTESQHLLVPKMEYYLTSLFALVGAVSAVVVPAGSSAVVAAPGAGTPVTITPHAQFGSSIGVLGCMINTNRGM